jgi:hypothetical protein
MVLGMGLEPVQPGVCCFLFAFLVGGLEDELGLSYRVERGDE